MGFRQHVSTSPHRRHGLASAWAFCPQAYPCLCSLQIHLTEFAGRPAPGGIVLCGGWLLVRPLAPDCASKNRFPVEIATAVDYGRNGLGVPCGVRTGVPHDNTGDARRPPSSKVSVLRKHEIFSDLDNEALEQLGRYAKHTVLKRGATIFSKGDPGNSLYAVISGTVKISISSPDGRNAILNLIGPGETFGEMSVLDGQTRSADAIANTNCEIYVIDRRDFLPFMRSQSALSMKFIELLCARLRWTSDQVEQVILQDLPGRLASALLGLTEKRKLEPTSQTIAITQQEISEMVGMTRESINKQLRAWAARSWVRLEHGAIVVLDTASLRELAEAGAGTDD